ncbi:MAG: nonstructural protein [Microvirus sp.]|nr:MAG: nonstructural protein [Microvirus sp.]
MKYIAVSVRDRAADIFGSPAFVPNLGSAIRAFGDAVNGKDSDLSKHPEDFDLYVIGNYDDENGALESSDPKQVAIGKDMKIRE